MALVFVDGKGVLLYNLGSTFENGFDVFFWTYILLYACDGAFWGSGGG